MNNKLVIIDSDGLVFQSSRDTLEESIEILNSKIQNIYSKTEATHSIFFISEGKYFRHLISNNTYKANRSKSAQPLKWLKTLKAYLKENYNAQGMPLVEADDLVAYWSQRDFLLVDGIPCSMPIEDFDEGTKIEPLDVVMCSPDKDLLQSIEGTFFNYSYKLEDKTKPEDIIKGWWVTTTGSEARGFSRGQLIFGDAGDSVSGLPKKGIKYWERMCLVGKVTLTAILEEYITHYGESQGIYEFQKNYRLLHLLSTDEDYLREIGELPTFPIVNEIKSKEIITAEYI